MDIEDSDSNYQSGIYPTLAERLAIHRQLIKDYSSDNSDKDSGLDRPSGHASPPQSQ